MAPAVKLKFLVVLARFKDLQAVAEGGGAAAEMAEMGAMLHALRFEPALLRLRRLVATHNEMDHA